MERNQDQAYPIYYPAPSKESPIAPFIVAPLGGLQDTLVVGPQMFSAVHDDFINVLYAEIGQNSQMRGLVARAFVFRSTLCVALIFPTLQKDEGGRAGLTIALGFCVFDRRLRRQSSILAEYMDVFLKQINNQFELALPSYGADRLSQLLSAGREAPQRVEVVNKLDTVLHCLSLASATVGSFGKLRRWWSFPNIRLWRKPAKVIFYESGTAYKDILHIFLKELGRGLRKSGKAGVEELTTSGAAGGKGLIVMSSFPRDLGNIKNARMGRCRGTRYIILD